MCNGLLSPRSMSLKEQIEQLRQSAARDLAEIKDLKALEAFRVKYVGRNGAVTAVLEGLRNATKEEKPILGKLSNELKTWLAGELESWHAKLSAQSVGPAKQS